MTRTLPVGRWATLTLFSASDTVPPSLSAVDYFWQAEARRLPVLLNHGGLASPYVAVVPDDSPIPVVEQLTSINDLEGIVLAQVTLSLVCQACGASFAGLYAETGLPYFSSNLARHRMVSGCPACLADYQASKLQAMVLLGER